MSDHFPNVCLCGNHPTKSSFGQHSFNFVGTSLWPSFPVSVCTADSLPQFFQLTVCHWLLAICMTIYSVTIIVQIMFSFLGHQRRPLYCFYFSCSCLYCLQAPSVVNSDGTFLDLCTIFCQSYVPCFVAVGLETCLQTPYKQVFLTLFFFL